MKIDEVGISKLSLSEINDYFLKAENSLRHRYPKILHQKGDEFNRVFNFMKGNSYMQPHHHPSDEKIEKMYLIQGKFAVIFFDDKGKIKNIITLEKGKKEYIEIPAFDWHTYVMLSDEVICYETMMGKYEPDTWKKLADWAPSEDSPESVAYLNLLKQKTNDIKSSLNV
jgi:cupin fold WbuC family metalloprotein